MNTFLEQRFVVQEFHSDFRIADGAYPHVHGYCSNVLVASNVSTEFLRMFNHFFDGGGSTVWSVLDKLYVDKVKLEALDRLVVKL